MNLTLAVGLVLAVPLVPAALAADYTIVVTSSLSSPSITVPPGSTVVWDNQDSERHRFRSTAGPVDLDTGDIDPGQTGSVVLSTAGTYSYIDDRDDSNAAYFGTIVVSSSASTTTTTAVPGGGPVEVRMAGRVFSPGSVAISAGSSVKFVNDDNDDHTATASGGSFDTGVLSPGATSTKVFSIPGTFSYSCAIHPDMTGTVTVTGSGGTAPPPPASTSTTTWVPPVVGSSDVSIFDFGYDPSAKLVPVGSTVRFVNTGVALHTVTDQAGRFDSGLISSGASFSRLFDVAGTFEIFCQLHPQMSATLSVTDSSGEVPPPPSPTTTTSPPAVSAGSGDVLVRDFSFAPASISVRAGSSLTFVNAGAAPHTVTATDRSFDSGLVQPGGTYTHRFNQPGILQYVCTLHPQMLGTVTVLDASGNPPSTTTSTIDGALPDVTASTFAVDVIDLDYSPRQITVPVGSTVVWTNQGVAPHTVTARDGSFGSELLQTAGVYSYLFETPGRFEYHCTLHPDMVGLVEVEGAAATADVSAAVGSTGAQLLGASQPASNSLGWITVGIVAAMVFGGGIAIFAVLRRSLLTG